MTHEPGSEETLNQDDIPTSPRELIQPISNFTSTQICYAVRDYLNQTIGATFENPENHEVKLHAIMNFATQASIPFAMWVENGHAHAVLTGPFQLATGEYAIRIFDPMNGNTFIRKISPEYASAITNNTSGMHNMGGAMLLLNPLAIKEMRENNYNLTMENEPVWIFEAKNRQIQYDFINCTILSCMSVATRWAALYGDNLFKASGVQFLHDNLGIRIQTRKSMREKVRIFHSASGDEQRIRVDKSKFPPAIEIERKERIQIRRPRLRIPRPTDKPRPTSLKISRPTRGTYTPNPIKVPRPGGYKEQ
jgi:hypothetical protein